MRNRPHYLRNLHLSEYIQKDWGTLGALVDGSGRTDNYIKDRVEVYMKLFFCDPVIAYNDIDILLFQQFLILHDYLKDAFFG